MSVLQAGLCSVTLRTLAAPQVIEVAARCGLGHIEWGGDVHVPHGDLVAAAEVSAATTAAGLAVCSYGSYLFADDTATQSLQAVLDTTEALGAPAVRVWAPFGVEPCGEAGTTAVDRVAAVLQEVAAAAAQRGLWVYLEFHGGTLTADARSAVGLLDLVGAANLLCAWQPPYWAERDVAGELEEISLLGSRLAHLHVYAWTRDGTRLALAEQGRQWHRRLGAASSLEAPSGFQRVALIEFVRGDDPAVLAQDAKTLASLLGRGACVGEDSGG